jgi:putative acetyltransferase
LPRPPEIPPQQAKIALAGDARLPKIAKSEKLKSDDSQMLKIMQAETPEHIATARELILEYATWLEFNLCFQGFEEEMRTLPGKYAPPGGRLLLALWEGRPAGVIALRPLDEGEGLCEMKRLYVRADFRGHGIGRALAERVIADAGEIGYARMRLDTIPGKMEQAVAMYRELGFVEIVPYYSTPVGQTLFMERVLNAEMRSQVAGDLEVGGEKRIS